MPASRVVFASEALAVVDYACTAGRGDRPFAEEHVTTCLAFTYAGSYGYRVRGRQHELVTGAFLVGRAGDEYACTHDHHAGGDRCLSVHLSPAFADELGGRTTAWERGTVPPVAELAILGQLATAAAHGETTLGVDEVALVLCTRYVALATGKAAPSQATHVDRRRAVDAAMWIAANANRPIALADAAAHAGLSPYHFLRTFSRTIGVSPHQYLVRVRLATAARMLAGDDPMTITDVALAIGFADLSNFVRTFHRAAGVTPTAFRRAARGERKILQARIAASR